jgi:serine/threonine kinase 32
VQVVLDETGSWSDLAKQDATLPADAKIEGGRPNGMLGVLE